MPTARCLNRQWLEMMAGVAEATLCMMDMADKTKASNVK